MSSLNSLGTPFIELSSVDSTNNYAMGLVRAGMAYHGLAVFAHEQTAGRGQRSKQWFSDKNCNIILSIVLDPSGLKGKEMFLLSMAMANATLQLFNKYAGGEAKIKWPNDIYWRDRKAAGILIENVWQGAEWKYAVVGIGMNINQVEFTEPGLKAVSLRQVTGHKYDPVLLAQELCKLIQEHFDLLTADPGKVGKEYRVNLYRLNESVKLKKDNVFDAVIKDVNDKGQLIVQSGSMEVFNVGEVEWLI